MSQLLHAGPTGLWHTLLDTGLSVAVGVAVVGLYLLVLRYYAGSDGNGTH